MNGQPGGPQPSSAAGAGGFLARIAARAEGGSAPGQLRPRPVSRFEQVRDDWEADGYERFADSSRDLDPTPPHGTWAAPTAAPLVAENVLPRPPRAVAAGADDRAFGVDRRVVAGAEEAAVEVRAEAARGWPHAFVAEAESVSPAAAGAPSAAASSAGATSARPALPRRSDTASPDPAPVAPSARAARGESHEAHDGRPPAPRPGRERPEAPESQRPSAAAEGAVLPERVDRSEQRSVAARRRQGPQSSAAPVVHVTIGRVEVRAVPPGPARAERSRPEEPAVAALDQYLRRRARSRG